jgi:hypothetical protein
MMLKLVEQSAWIGALVCTALGIAGLRASSAARNDADAATPVPPSIDVVVFDASALDSAVDTILDSDPFRESQDEAVRASAANPALQLAVSPKPPKPPLFLRGLLGGPPWNVMLDGVPGHDGSIVLHVGESFGGLTVRAVRRDTVVVQGADTTWMLTLKRP